MASSRYGTRTASAYNAGGGRPGLEQILRRLADSEGITTAVIANRLTGRLVDIANLRAANDIVIADTIPYTAGVSLVRDSWQMLRACATTSRGQKSHIHRFRKRADDIAKEARMDIPKAARSLFLS